MFTIDAHLDLSMNALEWNRDLTQPVAAINAREGGLTDKPDRAKAVVALPELRKGNIGLVVATQIGRYVAPDNHLPGWHSPQQAWAQTQGQLAWYKAMEDAGEMVQIKDLTSLESHVALWQNNENNTNKPVGYILSLEGADSIIDVSYLQIAYNCGLRALGPAHYGPGRYANGTDATGKMGEAGVQLLKEMERLNIILDATHLCDDAFWQALDNFGGHVWASHNNCRALVNHNRQYSDEMIKALINRGAVIGAALDAWMMVPGWVRGQSDPKQMNCNLEVMANHIDHICQLAGNTLHVGMGTDLDGAFGREQCPYDLETIADLQKVPNILLKRGYSQTDIENMMNGNWMRFLRNAWK
ncbi:MULTISPECIES: dipeptidase [unclassified Mucilaginibacter]|uniref:dipeptidase n=1 Tax=unclassified Mucilaginibacter TaxID=2617802 RepID=UPI00095D3A48|nr:MULTISPECIES: membrane dipeptidase [unclassified Mucilaginibacter]OJW18410.1 MAG: peptidase M19 [Mucilaginibacter sp. 44-25]PLW89340.1 MAG: peptidase M19 [Mucilaginibacter sp.]PMP64649.1 MAG: peptidase M19 [Mucilaginibacter sp.]HEK20208.1 peptidase M19 [Bacteroidota bacterium]